MNNRLPSPNICYHQTIRKTIQKVIEHQRTINWDSSKQGGIPRKLLDVSKLINLGWEHTIDL
ncbi:hypothetical protein [Mariniflexile sp.]|uniref:hypothetical protein n=1 Tax=Mariniflexile sp. TaxID=1979402 RepID=UPI0035672A8B